MRKIIAAALGILISNSALAATWYNLPGAAGLVVQIDLESIAPAGDGLIKAWVTHSFVEWQSTRNYPIIQYKSALQLDVYNCAERSSDILQEVFYSDEMRGGNVVRSNSYPRKSLNLTDVVPDSVGEGALK